jgi:hypothetical protein
VHLLLRAIQLRRALYDSLKRVAEGSVFEARIQKPISARSAGEI